MTGWLVSKQAPGGSLFLATKTRLATETGFSDTTDAPTRVHTGRIYHFIRCGKVFLFSVKPKTPPVSHNQFLNSPTAAGGESIAMKQSFSYFSNLSFDRVTFCKKLISPSVQLFSLHFSAGWDYPSNTYTPAPSSLRLSAELHLTCFLPLAFHSSVSFLSPLRVCVLFCHFHFFFPPCFPIVLIMNARRSEISGKSSIILLAPWDFFFFYLFYSCVIALYPCPLLFVFAVTPCECSHARLACSLCIFAGRSLGLSTRGFSFTP